MHPVSARLKRLSDDQLLATYRDVLFGPTMISDEELELLGLIWEEVHERGDRTNAARSELTHRLLALSGMVDEACRN